MLTVFITVLFRTSFSKFRSWSNDKKEAQEEPIISRAPMERFIKVTLLKIEDRSLINKVYLLAFLLLFT